MVSSPYYVPFALETAAIRLNLCHPAAREIFGETVHCNGEKIELSQSPFLIDFSDYEEGSIEEWLEKKGFE